MVLGQAVYNKTGKIILRKPYLSKNLLISRNLIEIKENETDQYINLTNTDCHPIASPKILLSIRIK